MRLEFGVLVDNMAEIIATFDMFGTHLFYYDDTNKTYVEKPNSLVWNVPLSECRQVRHLDIAPAGNLQIKDYLTHGLNSLGFVSAVWNCPKLAEFADNPGLFVLIMENMSEIASLLKQNPKRACLLSHITGCSYVSKQHVAWLKKLKPDSRSPGLQASRIVDLFRRMQTLNSNYLLTSRSRELEKLFSHQRHWTTRGLELASLMITDHSFCPVESSWLLRTYNDNEDPEITRARKLLRELKDIDTFPGIVRARVEAYLTNIDALHPKLARKILNTTTRALSENNLFDIALLFIENDDIPPPILTGNEHITCLDSLESICEHAKRAQNCLWTMNVVFAVILRRIDLYTVKGSNTYTMSIDRMSLEIRMIEPVKPSHIKTDDLATIIDWHQNATNTSGTSRVQTEMSSLSRLADQ